MSKGKNFKKYNNMYLPVVTSFIE